MFSNILEMEEYLDKVNIDYRELNKTEINTIIKDMKFIYSQVDIGGFHIKKGLKSLHCFQKNKKADIYVFDIGSYAYRIDSANLTLPFFEIFGNILEVNFYFYLTRDFNTPNGFTYYEKY